MPLHLLTLLKRLVHFHIRIRRRHSRNVSSDVPLGHLESIEQAVHGGERTYRSSGTQTLHTTTITEVFTDSTHLATSSSSAESCTPWIPPELVSLILAKLWEEPLTWEERDASLKNVVLVNHTWLALMAYIASCDVHISNMQNASTFIRLFSGQASSQTNMADSPLARERAPFANENCRSITFHVDGRDSQLATATSEFAPGSLYMSLPAYEGSKAVSLVLHTMAAPAADRRHLPNLERISFRYVDCPFEDIFKHLEQEPFPQQVVRLSADFAFATARVRYAMSERWWHTRVEWRCYAPRESGEAVVGPLSNVRHLSLSGEMTAQVTIALLHWVCPNIETLEFQVPCLVGMEFISPLPPTLRTLVLRHPGRAALAKLREGAEKEWHWWLCMSLAQRLFPDDGARPRRVVVRLSTHDPVLFVALRQTCEWAQAELVYERDDHTGSASL